MIDPEQDSNFAKNIWLRGVVENQSAKIAWLKVNRLSVRLQWFLGGIAATYVVLTIALAHAVGVWVWGWPVYLILNEMN
jgi:hypothetical protein